MNGFGGDSTYSVICEKQLWNVFIRLNNGGLLGVIFSKFRGDLYLFYI